MEEIIHKMLVCITIQILVEHQFNGTLLTAVKICPV